MKYTSAIISLLTLLSTSTAQSFADVPRCASQAAINSFTNAGCALNDFPCICKNQNFLASLVPVVEKACTPEELKKTVDFTTQFCLKAGVPIAVTTSGAASTSTPTSTVAAPMATASNGTLIPGNSTQGGVPQSPNPTPQPAPNSGVAGLARLAKQAGVLGLVVVGAVISL
ncbi:MAG: hypothetical protein Q9223_004562 [Gallowayella weberi]